jgi:hypothetical protein
LALSAPSFADAHSAASVDLRVDDSCPNIDRAELARQLDIEQGRDAGVQHARVSVRCEGEVALLSVETQGEPAQPRARKFLVSEVSGDVGARVLSLAAIELWETTPPESPPVALKAGPRRGPEPSPATAPQFSPAVRLMAAGHVQTFELAPPLLGGGIAVDYLRLRGLGLRLQFDVGVAERDFPQGEVRLQLATLSAQAGYLAVHESWSVRAFAGYRFGSARISGHSAPRSGASRGTVAGGCGGPLLVGALGLRSGSLVSEVAAEAGLVSFPIEGRVAGSDPVAFDGYWLGLSLNVGALL